MSGRQRPLLIASLAWILLTPSLAGAAEPADEPTATYYLISLNRAPLGEAVEAVLIQTLGVAVTVDPGLEASVTFRISETATPAELTEQFSVALSEEGIALVRTEGGYRLMDLETAWDQPPGLDIVSVPPPELRLAPNALITPPSAADVAPAPPRPSLPALTLAVLSAGLLAGFWAWRHRGKGRLLVKTSIGRRRVFPPATVRDRDAVIDRLIATQKINLAVLAAACDAAARRGAPVEQALCDLGGVSDQALADAYAATADLPRWRPTAAALTSEPAASAALGQFLHDRALRLVEADDWALTVATSDPLDDAAFVALCRLSGRMATFVVAARSDLTAAPFGDAAQPRPRPAGLIIPWSPTAEIDGAGLLQAILARRIPPSPT